MKDYIYRLIYGASLNKIIFLMIFLLFFWAYLNRCSLRGKLSPVLWKSVNCMGFLASLLAIFLATLVSRGGTTEVILKPFHFLEEAKQQPEIYRSMLMNVFLFFPLGLTIPFVLPKKWKGKIFLAILAGLVLSASIEYTQYVYALGRAEVDDILCNTFGCFLGALSCLVRIPEISHSKL